MSTVKPTAFHTSNIEPILILPEQIGSSAIADGCRMAALTFINESERWDKTELSKWLKGPYAELTQYSLPAAIRRRTSPSVPLLRDVDVRMVERVIHNAHTEVVGTLQLMGEAESAASFAFAMLSSGFVARCEDRSHVPGWIPTTDARRLSDRVLSLFAADYFARPADYESELSVCTQCNAVDFDADMRMRGICSRHGSMFVPRTRYSTLPHFPEGA